MKRVIRSTRTRLYYSHGHWTADHGMAQHFPDTQAAIENALRENLPEVEVVLQLGEEPSQYDVSFRIERRSPREPRGAS